MSECLCLWAYTKTKAHAFLWSSQSKPIQKPIDTFLALRPADHLLAWLYHFHQKQAHKQWIKSSANACFRDFFTLAPSLRPGKALLWDLTLRPIRYLRTHYQKLNRPKHIHGHKLGRLPLLFFPSRPIWTTFILVEYYFDETTREDFGIQRVELLWRFVEA